MSTEELKKFVLPDASKGEGLKEWIPEEFGFIPKDETRSVFYKGRFELRRFKYNNWLLRKKIRNKNNNSEMLIKWGMIVIEPQEKEFANMMFTLGLR